MPEDEAIAPETKIAVTKGLKHGQLIRLRCLELAMLTPRHQEKPGALIERAEEYREYVETRKIPAKKAAKGMRRVK